MKRYLSILLSVIVLGVSVPALPVQASSVAIPIDYDMALEIYFHILTLVENGRISCGYQDSIFSSDSYQDFLAHKSEIDAYITAHPEQFTGVTYYAKDGSVTNLDDWKNKDWVKDGNVITGGIGYKLSLLDNSDLEQFNQGMGNNSFNENNNNPFEKIKKVLMGAGAVLGGAGLIAGIKGLLQNLDFGSAPELSNPYGDRDQWFNSALGKTAHFKYFNGSEWISFSYTPASNQASFLLRRSANDGLLVLCDTTAYSYIWSEPNTWFWYYLSLDDFLNGRLLTDIPVFLSQQDFMNYKPANYWYDPFNTGILINGFQNNFGLPLLDTNIRPFGYIALANALAAARNALGLGSDADENAQEWAEEQPDIINIIIPDYVPDPDPDPVPPPPEPDPEPDEPDPDPDPDPDFDPDDPVLDEIPIISGLQNRFPFSIPWDLKVLFSSVQAERRAPHWEYTFYVPPKWLPPNGFSYTFEIDLSQFEYLASLMRRLFLLAFIIGLAIYSYGKFFGGGD